MEHQEQYQNLDWYLRLITEFLFQHDVLQLKILEGRATTKITEQILKFRIHIYIHVKESERERATNLNWNIH